MVLSVEVPWCVVVHEATDARKQSTMNGGDLEEKWWCRESSMLIFRLNEVSKYLIKEHWCVITKMRGKKRPKIALSTKKPRTPTDPMAHR